MRYKTNYGWIESSTWDLLTELILDKEWAEMTKQFIIIKI